MGKHVRKNPNRFNLIQKSLVFAIVAISSILTVSDESVESSAEYSATTEAYASIRMLDWVPNNVAATSYSNTGRCAYVSWDRPDDSIYQYMIGISKNADFSNRSEKWIESWWPNSKETISGLELNTKYYVRVYAANNWNWEWSEMVTFTTLNTGAAC